MSGHSKWANIKVRKGAQDKKRGEVFSRMAKDILTAVREGGGNTNPESNSWLRAAVEKAREVNMPKDNVERLLKNFEERKANLVEVVMEGYGPLGVPIIVETETDNKNRTLGEVKSKFRKYGGDLGVGGSVLFLFQKRGVIDLEELSPEIELEVIDWGVEDIDGQTLVVDYHKLADITGKIRDRGWKVTRSEVVMRPTNPVMLGSEDEVARVMELVEELEDNEDVVKVWAGFDYKGRVEE